MVRKTHTDFEATKRLFTLPGSLIYLDGNSLGAMPKNVSERVQKTVDEQWGVSLIRGWNDHGWVHKPSSIGDRIGKLIGAENGTVLCGDNTSINVFKALATAVKMRPDRHIILSDTGNFPTDLYMAQGLSSLLEQGHELRLVEPEGVEAALDETIAVMMLTEVDYRTGRRHNMKSLTAKAHEVGALTLWDLAHSAGAFPVHLDACEADFAVGCGYKYLNGGPGAPAFVYAAKRHHEAMTTPLAGWWGHETPFSFDLDYRPASGINQMRVGTPSVLAMAAMEAALDLWDLVSLDDVRIRSVDLCELFIAEVERRCPELTLASPRSAEDRGSQVSFHAEEGYAIMQALIADGVIGDFRAPDIIRFGFTPLYIGPEDVVGAAEALERILKERRWDRPEFKVKAAVT
ncbi:kynureninase [Pseudovibrio sp. SPO723]|nr:kynureninase [Pseudovibrio sp. SPO723]